jgi:hypothetical protein
VSAFDGSSKDLRYLKGTRTAPAATFHLLRVQHLAAGCNSFSLALDDSFAVRATEPRHCTQAPCTKALWRTSGSPAAPAATWPARSHLQAGSRLNTQVSFAVEFHLFTDPCTSPRLPRALAPLLHVVPHPFARGPLYAAVDAVEAGGCCIHADGAAVAWPSRDGSAGPQRVSTSYAVGKRGGVSWRVCMYSHPRVRGSELGSFCCIHCSCASSKWAIPRLVQIGAGW